MDEILNQVESTIDQLKAGTARKSEVITVLEAVKKHLAAQPAVESDPVTRAVGTMSYSECKAIKVLIDQLPEDGGLFVASQVADRVGLTRSVFVNGLRKLESAGVIQSRSLGMKGTLIKPLVAGWRERLQLAVA